VKDFALANPGWTFFLAWIVLYLGAWTINAVFVEIRKMVRGYPPIEPHCHECAKEDDDDD
jgi:hypothetical protein